MTSPLPATSLSVNALAAPLVEALAADAERLRLAVHTDASGARIIDAGLSVAGSVEAGLAIGEICMGGLGSVQLRHRPTMAWPTWLEVRSSQPVLACLASQYAGWSLAASKEETGGKKFFSLGSGPGRALAGKETLFEELGYRDHATTGCLVLEVDRLPPAVVIQKVLRDTGLTPEALTFIVTPTSSVAGTTQVVARVLEVALHKAHTIGFNLPDILDGNATAPLPAPHADGLVAMGRTNDAILYGGQVHLTVGGTAEEAQRLARELPSTNSKDHGRSFADIFKQVDYDFYKIDPALFAPAEVWVSHQASGQTWHAGHLALNLLNDLWLQQA
jgi:methenyltetrahydromethanopterin cyclohydrolase